MFGKILVFNQNRNSLPKFSIFQNDTPYTGLSTMRRSYNRLSEPIPPRSSLRQKKLEEFYSMAGGGSRQRSVSVGARSLLGDSLGSYGETGKDEDDDDSFGTGSYMYVDRSIYSETSSNRLYEDPYLPRDKDPTNQLIVQNPSPSRSPALPPRNSTNQNSSPRYPHRNHRDRARNRSPTKLYDKIAIRNSPTTSPVTQPVSRRLDFSEQSAVRKAPKPPPVYERKDDYMKSCRTLFAFRGEFDGCLNVQKSEKLLLHKNLNDGWSLVENEQKTKGFVPTDYLEFEI